MILQALAKFATREGLVPFAGYQVNDVRWEIRLQKGGKYAAVRSLDGGTKGKETLPARLTVPTLPSRRAGKVTRPNFLVDTADYVLGFSVEKPERAQEKNEAFRDQVANAVEATGDEDLKDVLAFLDDQEQIDKCVDDLRNQLTEAQFNKPLGTFCFASTRDETRMHDRDSMKTYWGSLYSPTETPKKRKTPKCMACGKNKTPAVLHAPISKVKGIVAIDNEAFESYGFSKNENAPFCLDCVSAYVAAVSRLHNGDADHRPHRFELLGDSFALFWSEAPEGVSPLDIIDSPSEEAVSQLLALEAAIVGDSPAKPAHLDAPFHALVMARGIGRTSIRSYQQSTLRDVYRNVAQFYQDTEVDKPSGTRWHGIYTLTRSLLPPGAKGTTKSINMGGHLFRCIVQGSPVPDAVVDAALTRSEKEGLTAPRVALIRASLLRRFRVTNPDLEKEIHVSLNPTLANPAYCLGRAFATIEHTQRSAIQSNNGVDRYYAAACHTPRRIFDELLEKNRGYVRKIRSRRLSQTLDDILDLLPGGPATIPANHSKEDRCLFALGYTHQKCELRRESDRIKTKNAEAVAV